LRRNPALGLVDASAWHGTITLTGTVDHYQDRADAEAAVRELSGVRNLQTAITVAATPVDDFELQKRLEDRLRFARADMGITFPQVRVEVHDGIVVLSGTVKDSIERSTALALVGSTDGVISVREELSIGPDLLTNDDVRTEINKAIYHGSDATSSTLVHATFRDGTVTLMGAVATPKEKEDRVSRLRDIYGVRPMFCASWIVSVTQRVENPALRLALLAGSSGIDDLLAPHPFEISSRSETITRYEHPQPSPDRSSPATPDRR
jgi:osmotically-inducible protein OsmY